LPLCRHAVADYGFWAEPYNGGMDGRRAGLEFCDQRPHIGVMALKVYDLECAEGHVFEGWFASADSYESQQSRGLLSCPVCGGSQVSKKLSAPRLNVGHIKDSGADSAQAAEPVAAAGAGPLAEFQAQVFKHMRQLLRNTENVGARFAEEARRMHEGEAKERAIRGTATHEEKEALQRDGIAVMPIPDFLDDDRLQ